AEGHAQLHHVSAGVGQRRHNALGGIERRVAGGDVGHQTQLARPAERLEASRDARGHCYRHLTHGGWGKPPWLPRVLECSGLSVLAKSRGKLLRSKEQAQAPASTCHHDSEERIHLHIPRENFHLLFAETGQHKYQYMCLVLISTDVVY